MKDKILEEIMKECNVSEGLVKLLVKICLKFKINNYEKIIKDYLRK